MKKVILTAAILLLSFEFAFGQSLKISDLKDEINSGNVSLTAMGNGASTGFAVDGFLRNNTHREMYINVFINNGIYLVNSGAGQNMLATQVFMSDGGYYELGNEIFIILQPLTRIPISLRALCADQHLDNPNNRESFTLASTPADISNIATKISRYMALNIDRDIDIAAQLALWREQGVSRERISMSFRFTENDWALASRIMN